jgi:hypothetical protein
MKVFNEREIKRILKDNGYSVKRSNGTSHEIWENKVTGDKLSLNSKHINRMVWQRLVKEHNIKCQF